MEDGEVTIKAQVAFCEVVSSNVDQCTSLSETSDSSTQCKDTHEESI